MSPSERDAILMRGRWFAGLPASLRRELLDRSEVRTYRRGAWIYMQGDPPRGLWGIVEGDVSFSRIGGNGSELLYHVGGPSMWFGVLGILTGMPMPLSVTAVTDVAMLFIRRSDILAMLDREPRHTLRLVKLPLMRGLDLIELAEHIVRPTPRSRVASRLLLLARMADDEDSAGHERPLRISQSQLAQMTALSRQSVSRVLHELAAAGAITPGFRVVEIKNPQLLEALASAPE